MIYGIGTDLCDVGRIEKSIARPAFLQHVLIFLIFPVSLLLLPFFHFFLFCRHHLQQKRIFALLCQCRIQL